MPFRCCLRFVVSRISVKRRTVYIYNLDLNSLTAEQRERLVQFVALKFGVAPALVNEDLESLGFPIRAVDVDLVYIHRDIGRFL
jgi:hypothetical protein